MSNEKKTVPDSAGLLAKLELPGLSRTVKTIAFTSFAIYAAITGEGRYLTENAPPELINSAWYAKIVLVEKYAYGLAAGLLFYFLLFHKYAAAPFSRSRRTSRRRLP